MKKIIFQKIKIQNFLSFGNDPIELDITQGVNFITGINKDEDSMNGVGKTALIIESLFFVLFGKTYRDINQNKLINRNATDHCFVQLFFKINDDEYEIVRSIKPNKLIFKKNGTNKERTVTETNKDILSELGTSKEMILNTLLMTNNDRSSFINQEAAHKTKFVEGIANLEIFSKMFDKAKSDYNALLKVHSKKEVQISEAEKNIESDKRYAAQEEVAHNRKKDQLREQIIILRQVIPVDYSLDIDKLFEELEALEESLKSDISDKDKINIKKASIAADLKNAKNKLNEYNSKRFECPTCKKPLDDCDDKEHIEKEKEGLRKEIEELEGKIKKVDAFLLNNQKNVSTKNSDIYGKKSRIGELQVAQDEFETVQQKINDLNTRLDQVGEFVSAFASKIIESQKILEDLKKEFSEIDRKLKIKDMVKFLCSPTGAKPRIIKKIIGSLNNRLNFYLKKLNAPCTCVFDEFFQEKFFDKNGEEISYGNLSGGESKRVDFAILFTFRDIRKKQSGVFINISVFDELFDSALDGKAMHIIISMLKEISEQTGEAFYVITHRPENIEVEGCNTITLEKENDTTRIVKN